MVLVRLDRGMRRVAKGLLAYPGLGSVMRLVSDAVRPLRRRLVGRVLDREAEQLCSGLASHPPRRKDAQAPLRIAFLCALWNDRTSGIAVWTRVLGEALARQGHDVTVFVVAEDGEESRFENGVAVRTVPAAALRRFPPLPPLPSFVADRLRGAFAAVLAEHAREPFDVVSGPIWQIEPLAVLSSGIVPVAVSLHTTQAMLSSIGVDADDVARQMIEGERALLAAAPIVVANTEAAAADIAASAGVTIAPRRLLVVPHGLPDVAQPDVQAGGAETRLLFIGRLDHRKGIDTLLDAVPAVMAQGGVTLDIAGAPHGASPEPVFRARHEGAEWLDRVRFHGGVDEDTKLALLAASDIVVLPARYESFGLVAVEAMRVGKPVVSTRAGGIPEVVEDGVTGLLVPPSDAAAVARALGRLVADKAERVAMGEAGRARFRDRFTDEAMASTWAGAIRSALASRLQ